MPQISYIGADGKTYTYDLKDVDLSQIDLSGVSNSIDNNTFIDWTNPNFEVPIQVGNLGGDPQFNLTMNSMSYLQNMMKSSTQEDYDRWTQKFKDEIAKTLVYEATVLKNLIERYNTDYGQPSPDISGKIQTIIKVSNDTSKLVAGFSSLSGVSTFLASFAAALVPLAIITGAIVVIDTVVKKAEQPKRQEQVLTQANKVQGMIEAFSKPQLIDNLRKFDKPAPKPNENQDMTPYYIGGGILLYMIFIAILKKIKSQ